MAFCQSCGTLMENGVCPNCGATNVPVGGAATEPQPIYAEPQPAYAETQPVYAEPQQPTVPLQPTYAETQQPPVAPPPPYGGSQPPYGAYPPPYYPPQKPAPEPVSAGGWIWRSLLSCIPVVGWIIYLVMLFVWMGDETKEESFRNWAKAQLIMMAVILGVGVLFFFLIVFTLVGSASIMAGFH